MRLWSLHPRLLDRQGLTALWREGLLAQAVLAGRTRGYTRHPQLERFRAQPEPVAAIGGYLAEVATEAEARGYRYDRTRLDVQGGACAITVTDGQLAFEWAHLTTKLERRSPEWLAALPTEPAAHPCCRVVPGPIADWERP